MESDSSSPSDYGYENSEPDNYKNDEYLMPKNARNAKDMVEFIRHIDEYSQKLKGAYYRSKDEYALNASDIHHIPTTFDMFNFCTLVHESLVVIDHMFDDFPKYNKVVLNSGSVEYDLLKPKIAQFREFLILRQRCNSFMSRKEDIVSNQGLHWVELTIGDAYYVFNNLLQLLKSRFADVRRVVFHIKPNETLRGLAEFNSECAVLRVHLLSIIDSIFPEVEDFCGLDAETLHSTSDDEDGDEQVGEAIALDVDQEDGKPYATE